ncbi:dTDP-4-dehydrorhamnose reductase [Flavivirga sp. 57AJ16]|uniref:dTDP-4-dehydrorhamnose reductase n=1 Tax=Flavivirga sp. 57AJ16 TaxID=3025307 RepID=UPI00236520C6|nr:dTDP-4-dehydrorhamnose reductase [Flavivirga sp. 57AJ16]MDD7885931.1 dTDP-4-dehydrorhamnose reductase [Flavivirga sp. 57AJ16]
MKNKVIKQPITSNQRPTTVLVTGANGQLGKTIEELYADNQNNLGFVFVSKEELDITKAKDLRQFFNNNNFDYCINCAAYTNVEQAEKTPETAFKVNAEGVKNLAEVCKEKNVVLIHISTDYVFDGEKNEPYTVDDIPNPINEYGRSKLLGEQYVQEILQKYFIIRTSWLYSKKYGNNFYKTILKKVKKGKTFFVTDEQIGCPTDTASLALYIISFIEVESTSFGICHFCDEEAMTWYQFAKQILKENNLLFQMNLIKAKKYFTFAARPKSTILIKKKI